ncbi:MAG: CDP-glycerol--glycerophosphate glycerophosphotransferase [Gammaproteobacteria bacterium]|nr:CDP-glycerol--glycerophosphate glycerophosphotransferase [Gammaproteobacteria bacterium]
MSTRNDTRTATRILLYVEQDYSFAILRPLQDEARARGITVRWMVLPPADPGLLTGDETRVADAADAVNYCPDLVFAPGDRVPGFIPGLKVQVFHGLNEDKRGNRYPERGLFDLYCTEGPQRTRDLTETLQGSQRYRVVETGWVKLDALLQAKDSAARPAYERPQVLFASTFTPKLSGATALLPEIERLAATGEWQWLITLHPKSDPAIIRSYQALAGPHLQYFGTEHVIDLQHRADVMVSDNSSVLQEFMLLGKPVATYRNRDPHPAMIDFSVPAELEPSVRAALTPDPDRQAELARYAESITPWLDGRSAGRILDAAITMLDEGWQNQKPANLLRNWRMRQQHRYYKFY